MCIDHVNNWIIYNVEPYTINTGIFKYMMYIEYDLNKKWCMSLLCGMSYTDIQTSSDHV